MPTFSISNLKVVSGIHTGTPITLNVSPEDGILGLYGSHGSGISTVLEQLAGLHPAAGEIIKIGDRTVDQLPPDSRGISHFVIPEEWPAKTVRAWLLERLPMDETGAAETRIRESLEALGFAPHEILDRVVSQQLSRMQQIRVGIARALLKGPLNGPPNGPEVLLLDRLFEAFPVTELLFPLAMLRRVAKQRQLVVIVATHRPEVVALLGPKVAVLAHGSLEAFGPRAALAEQPQSLEILRAVSPAGLTEIPGTVVRVVSGAPSASHSYRFEGPFGLKIPLESDDICPSQLRFNGNVAEAVLCVSPHDLLDADVTRSDPRIIRIDPATVEVMGDVTTGRWSVVPHDLSLPFLRIGREACDSRMAGCLHHPREICLLIRRMHVFAP